MSKTPQLFNQLPGINSPAWVAQTWIAFVVSVAVTATGILYLPVDAWMKAFLGMGLSFSVGSTLSLAKTVRDEHEAKRFLSRVDDAKLQRILAETEPV